tara:strand:+ start:3001 stop:3285 length:285 start_codon:yes stop_codon:yes gene_type:complete
MNSIRQRIVLRVLGLLLCGSLILSAVSYGDAAHEVEELFDAQLGQSARVLQGLLRLPQAQIDHAQLAQTTSFAQHRRQWRRCAGRRAINPTTTC